MHDSSRQVAVVWRDGDERGDKHKRNTTFRPSYLTLVNFKIRMQQYASLLLHTRGQNISAIKVDNGNMAPKVQG